MTPWARLNDAEKIERLAKEIGFVVLALCLLTVALITVIVL